jgi:hypothetical protein
MSDFTPTPNADDPEMRARLTAQIAQSSFAQYEAINQLTINRLEVCLSEKLMDSTDLVIFVEQMSATNQRVLDALQGGDWLSLESFRTYEVCTLQIRSIAFRIEQVVRRYAMLYSTQGRKTK